jgi:hypothetical protein
VSSRSVLTHMVASESFSAEAVPVYCFHAVEECCLSVSVEIESKGFSSWQLG